MNVIQAATNSFCYVLREDPDLAEAIGPADRSDAIQDLTVPEIRIPSGGWTGQRAAPDQGAIGLLVLKGMLIRRVGIDGRFGAELLGEGDLLAPWQDGEDSPLPLITGWSVVLPARLAVLDERFARKLARHPQLTARLVARALQRSRQLTVNMAIVHQARVDVRLHMLFWHLAGRWGRVRVDGTLIPLRLTHSVLADLVAARRPTVTSALSQLAKRGLVRSAGDGWVISGEPPGHLLAMAAGGG